MDFLLHYENYKLSTAGKLTKESLTIPSIVRQAQFENLLALLDRIQKEENFVQKWLEVEGQRIKRNRKKHNELITLEEVNREQIRDAA